VSTLMNSPSGSAASAARRVSRGLAAAALAAALAVTLASCSSSGPPAAGSTPPGSLGAATSPAADGPSSGTGTSGAGASGTSTSGAAASGTGVIFQGTLQVTGAVVLKKNYTQKMPAVGSCAAAAAHGDSPGGGFRLPSPRASGFARIDVLVGHIHGAGTYAPNQLATDSGDSIWLTFHGASRDFEITSHPAAPGKVMGKEVLYLNADGSGQLAFSGAHAFGQKSGPQIAGEISWSCSAAR